MTTPIIGLPARGMRRSLRWGLGATVLATVAVLLWPKPAVVGASTRSDVAKSSSPPSPSNAPVDRSAATLARPQPFAEAAATAASAGLVFDPFAGVVVAPPAAPLPVAAPAPVAPPPPPPPPVQDYRFLGRMTAPDGSQQVLLARGDASVSISKGMVLDNGYVVESISTAAVVLIHLPSGIRASILIPSP
jgi:hypothetical protein